MKLITPFLTTRSISSDFWHNMDKMFDDLNVDAAPAYDERQYNLATEVSENEQQYMLSMDLPGLKKEDIAIELQENVLTVSGERKSNSSSGANNKAQRFENFYGAFKRSFNLPSQVDASKIEARYEDGVLELNLPKVPTAQPKKIEIQSRN